MIFRGTILLHKNFIYEDGTAGKKYLILLNTPKKNDPYLVVKTTSQRKNKPQTAGCIEDLSFFSYRPEQLFSLWILGSSFTVWRRWTRTMQRRVPI